MARKETRWALIAGLAAVAAVLGLFAPWGGGPSPSPAVPPVVAPAAGPPPPSGGLHPRKSAGMEPGSVRRDAASRPAPTDAPPAPGKGLLRVRVLRAAPRGPIAGAEVSLRGPELRASPGARRTGEDGIAEFEGLPPGPVVAHIEAPGLATAEVLAEAPRERTADAEVIMDSGWALAGTVVDPDGNPIPGALVCAAVEIDRSDAIGRHGSAAILGRIVGGGIPGELRERIAVAAEDGRFSLRFLPPGSQRICVAAEGPFCPRTVLIEGWGKGAVTEATLVLYREFVAVPETGGPGAVVRGALTAGSGEIAVASVRLRSPRPGTPTIGQARPGQGNYRIEGVPPGSYLLEARGHPGSALVPVEVPEGAEEVVVDLDLSGDRALLGTVVNGEGTPIEGAVVRAFPWEQVTNPAWSALGDAWIGDSNVRSGPDGRFRIERLAAIPYLLSAGAPGFGFLNEGPFTPGAPGDILLRLPPGTGVTVTLLGADGLPVRFGALGVLDSRGILVAEGSGDGMRLRGWGVAPGDYTVIAASPDEGFVALEGVRLAGPNRELRMRLAPTGAAVVSAVGPDGAPAAIRGNAVLVLEDGRGIPRAEPSGPHGRFTTAPLAASPPSGSGAVRFGGLSPARYRALVTTAAGRGEATFAVESGRTAEVEVLVR